MKPHRVLLTLLIALLVSSPALAQTATQSVDLVVLSNRQDKYPLGRHLDILRDPSRDLTFQDVSSPAYQDRFTLSQVDSPNLGSQKAVY